MVCLLPDELNPYLQCSPSVGIAHSTLSCERRCYGLRTSLSTSFNPCPRPLIGQERWVFEGACVRLRRLVISPVWVDSLVGSFDLLGRSTSDTSPVAQIIEIGAGYRVVDVSQPNILIPLGLLMNTPPLKK